MSASGWRGSRHSTGQERGEGELLTELRALLGEAEAWSRTEGGDAGEDAVDGLRAALAGTALNDPRDMIAV